METKVIWVTERKQLIMQSEVKPINDKVSADSTHTSRLLFYRFA